jgi:hypothetical protein
MGIIGNKTLLHKLPLTQVGGVFASDIATIPNWHCKENASKLSSVPNGYYVGGAWVLPETSGNLSVVNGIIGIHAFTVSNLAGGLNTESIITGNGDITTANLNALAFLISALNQNSLLTSDISGSVNVSSNLAGSGDLNGSLGALVSIVADLNGSGNLSASISGAVQAIAGLSSSGDLQGSIFATVELLSDLTGTSDLTSAIIGNWDMVSNLLGNSNLTSSIDAKAFLESNILSSNNLVVNNGSVVGSMSSNITSLSELSPESLASSVWNALASQYNVSGTMGEKMNGDGSAGNPWTEIIEGTYTASEVMRLLVSVAVGKTTIVDNGNNTATVVFRDLEDTEDRITAEMEGSERVNVALIP